MIIDWPCKWEGCTERLNENDHHKLTKYCKEHKKEALALRRKKLNKTRYMLRKIKKPNKCTVCKSNLSGNKTRFCSVKCSNEYFMRKKREVEIKKSIQYHSKKIQELVMRLK